MLPLPITVRAELSTTGSTCSIMTEGIVRDRNQFAYHHPAKLDTGSFDFVYGNYVMRDGVKYYLAYYSNSGTIANHDSTHIILYLPTYGNTWVLAATWWPIIKELVTMYNNELNKLKEATR